MKSNWIRHTPTALIGQVALFGAAGIWFWLAHWDSIAELLVAAAVVLTAILGIVWFSGARAARRFNAAMDAYADLEIDRQRRTNGTWKRGVVSIRGGGLAGGSITGGDRGVEAKEHIARRRPRSRQPVPTEGDGP